MKIKKLGKFIMNFNFFHDQEIYIKYQHFAHTLKFFGLFQRFTILQQQ